MTKEKRQREYVDKDHEVMQAYYNLYEKYSGRNAKTIKRKLKQLIERYPDFLDSYVFLYQILQDEGNLEEADKTLNVAYERALMLITDKKGKWSDILEWGWLENRHIIKAILNKAISLWKNEEVDNAVDLFGKLLKTNPKDNVGARNFILAIRIDMSFDRFENRFNKGGYYGRVPDQRPYFPIISPCARMCPDIAASSWDLVAPLFKLSVVSRAYTLKKYLWGLARRRAGSVITNPAKVIRTLQAAVVQGLVIWYRSGQPGAVGRNIVDHPVDPGFAGGVGVVHYQGDGLCA